METVSKEVQTGSWATGQLSKQERGWGGVSPRDIQEVELTGAWEPGRMWWM